MVSLVARDFPTHVADCLKWPGGFATIEDAYAAGLAGLRTLPALDHETFLAGDDESSRIHVFAGEDFLVASRVHPLPDLLGAAGVALPETGVLLAVPNRHLLAVHPLTGPGVLEAAPLLVALARGEHDGKPGPISRDVFHMLPDLSAISVGGTADDGSTRIDVRGSFHDAFGRLGLLEA